jgi:di- and tripeptidase
VNGKPEVDGTEAGESEDLIITTLREFVSYKTVSSRPEFNEDCRKGANFLASLFKRLGGQVEMLSTDKQHNPIVYAKFAGKLEPAQKRKRILFYGHYDVVAASTQHGKWATDPFRLTGTNGYLYGRGVSDNKGPITAALYAVTDLIQAKALDSDIIFLIEGEEESGSRGFQETIKRHKDMIGHVDYILLANSYWLDDEVPCLTYGLRGVLHATICIDSKHPDLHSGVDGSYMMSEPLSDLTCLLSKLKGPRNRIMIPNFYDGILPLTPEEEARYDDIAQILLLRKNKESSPTAASGPMTAEALKGNLMARWREPNLTIHRYKVSGPDGSLVSSHASANISLRLVPGQEVDEVIASLKQFLQQEFDISESANALTIRIDNRAEPWLGVPGNYIFRTLEEAVMQVWSDQGVATGEDKPETQPGEGEEASNGDIAAHQSDNAAKPDATNGSAQDSQPQDNHSATQRPAFNKNRKPLYIREGGSIPAIRFLEKEFGAPAAHLPCGQASDAAHLDNERLRVLNLIKSKEIFKLVFRRL